MLRRVTADAKFWAVLALCITSLGARADTVYLDCKGVTTDAKSKQWESEERIKLTLGKEAETTQLEVVSVANIPSMPELFSTKSGKDELNIKYDRTLYLNDEKIIGTLEINFGSTNSKQKHTIVLDRISGDFFHAYDLSQLGKTYATYEFRSKCNKMQKQF